MPPLCLFGPHPPYGNELETLLGRCADSGIRESQLRRMVRDALLVSPYITEVDGFSVSQSGSTVTAACTVHTLYDSFETEVVPGVLLKSAQYHALTGRMLLEATAPPVGE